MIEKDMTMSDSACNINKMLEYEKFENDTFNSILISILNFNNMMIMAAADFIVFYKWLISTHTLPSSSFSSSTSFFQTLYQKKIWICWFVNIKKKTQILLNIKSVITFNDTNYQMWKMMFLLNAEVIDDADIFNKNK